MAPKELPFPAYTKKFKASPKLEKDMAMDMASHSRTRPVQWHAKPGKASLWLTMAVDMAMPMPTAKIKVFNHEV